MFPIKCVGKTILSPLNYINIFIKNQLTLFIFICLFLDLFLDFQCCSLIYTSMLIPIPYHLNYYCFAESFKIRYSNSSNDFFLQNCLYYSRSFAFLHKFGRLVHKFLQKKNPFWGFDNDCVMYKSLWG